MNRLFPLWLKILYTAFMLVLVPVYWSKYGPTNFVYFCDIALFLTLVGLWRESPLLISMGAVGILLPQALWCVDFLFQLSGHKLTGMTGYMFDRANPLYLRGLSLFHGWLPVLLVILLLRCGYDRRALPWWTALAWIACLIAYFFLPPAGAVLPDPNTPYNVNYVHGLDDSKMQTLLPQPWYLLAWMLTLLVVVYIPTHFILKKTIKPAYIDPETVNPA